MMLREEIMSDFTPEWAQSLLSSPDLVNITSPDRRQPPPVRDRAPARLMSKTLWSETTFRARQLLRSKDIAPPNLSPEYYLLLSLGSDLDGWQNVMQGGLTGFIVDHTASMCATTEFKEGQALTGEMKLKYRRPVPVPSLVLARCAIEERNGRKIWIRTVVEDGQGTIYAEGTVLFVVKDAKL